MGRWNTFNYTHLKALILKESRLEDNVSTRALKSFELSARSGYEPAMIISAEYYLDGEQVPRNILRGKDWLLKAVNNNDEQVVRYAALQLGLMAFFGVGGAQNDNDARQWLLRAQDSAITCYLLSIIYQKEQNHIASIQQLHKQECENYSPSLNILAGYYRRGEVLELNRVKAHSLYLQAADKGYIPARWNLTMDYLKGSGTPVNVSLAKSGTALLAPKHLPARRLHSWFQITRPDTDSSAEADLRERLSADAEMGDPWSCYALGILWLEGVNGVASDVEGYAWMNLAAAFQYQEAAGLRDAIGIRLQPPDLEKAQLKSQERFNRFQSRDVE